MKPATTVLFLIAAAIGLLSQASLPKLTDAQKLEIRNAQVDFFQAKTAMEATREFQQFQGAQNKLNEIVLRVQKDAKVDQSKYRLEQSLEFSEIPQPKPAEKKP